jgi:hypothetical protein
MSLLPPLLVGEGARRADEETTKFRPTRATSFQTRVYTGEGRWERVVWKPASEEKGSVPSLRPQYSVVPILIQKVHQKRFLAFKVREKAPCLKEMFAFDCDFNFIKLTAGIRKQTVAK